MSQNDESIRHIYASYLQIERRAGRFRYTLGERANQNNAKGACGANQHCLCLFPTNKIALLTRTFTLLSCSRLGTKAALKYGLSILIGCSTVSRGVRCAHRHETSDKSRTFQASIVTLIHHNHHFIPCERRPIPC